MKKVLGILLLSASIFGFSGSAWAADQFVGHEKTTTPADARYEIIQSTMVAKVLLKLDRYSGNVWQLVTDENDNCLWQWVGRTKHYLDKATPNKPNYQIFTSGLAARYTFLMNVRTGATWQLFENTNTGAINFYPLP